MDGTFLEVNPAFKKFISYSLKELNKKSYWDLTPKEYEEQEAMQLKSLADTGKYGPYEKEYITKNGDRINVLLRGVKTKDISGDEYIWSVVQDITDSVRIKLNLELELQKMHLVLHDKDIIAWEYNLTKKTLFICPNELILAHSEFKKFDRIRQNKENYAFYEIALWSEKTTQEMYIFIHKDYQKTYVKNIKKLILGSDDSINFEIRMGNPQKIWKWYSCSINILLRDEEGKITKLFGVFQDIESKKNAESLEIRVQEEERIRVSRDIHDSVAQMLLT
jgi:PAS domain S-box-containing protein